MVKSATTPICGNAVLLQVCAAQGILYSKVLRRTDDGFTGPTDPDAAVVFVGSDIDVPDLSVDNGTTYYYKDYGWNGSAYVDDDGVPLAATCNPTYEGYGPEVRKMLKARLAAGFTAELTRGVFKLKGPATPGNPNPPLVTKLPGGVLLGPPDFKATKWPVCAVSVEIDTQDDRAVGETALGDESVIDETMLKRYSEQIAIWSQNADERAELHRALDRILTANLAVFNSLGLVLCEWRIEDANIIDRASFDTDIFAVACTFSCHAPAGVVAENDYPTITDIDVTINPYYVIDGVEIDDNAGVT